MQSLKLSVEGLLITEFLINGPCGYPTYVLHLLWILFSPGPRSTEIFYIGLLAFIILNIIWQGVNLL